VSARVVMMVVTVGLQSGLLLAITVRRTP